MSDYRSEEPHVGSEHDELNRFAIGEVEGKKAYSFAEECIQELDRLGLVGRKRPQYEEIHKRVFPGVDPGEYYDGRMPTVLTQLSLDEVSALLTLSTNWHGYISNQYSLVATRRKQAKKKKDLMWSMIRMKHREVGKKYDINYTDQRLSDLARFDSRFVLVDAEYEKQNTIYEMVGALLEVAKKEMDTISREVTIRQTHLEAEARGRGTAGRGNGSRYGRRPDPGEANLPSEKRRAASAKGNAASSKEPAKVRFAGKGKRTSRSS